MEQTDLRARPGEPFTIYDWEHRWPMGAEKCELVDGTAIWLGQYALADVEAARRAFPGHAVSLNEDGNLLVGPTSADPTA
jgi:hypothetical protein